MNYCENCGSKLEEGSVFCESCGAKVDGDVETTATTETTEKPKSQIEIKALTKKQKTIGIGLLTAIIILFLGFTIGKNVYSEENQKEVITDALLSKDPDKIAGVLTSKNANLDVTSETVMPLVNFLEDNPYYLEDLVTNLHNYNEYGVFTIVQEGKKLGLYDAYELQVLPIYFKVSTNLEGTVITLNGEELVTADKNDFTQEMGPFVPGLFNFEATGTVNGYELEATQTHSFLYPEEATTVNLELEGYEFSIQSDLSDATVYLDDEEIGTLTDGEGKFGPIKFEEGMQIHVEKVFDEGTIVSDPVDLNEYDSTYYFNNLVGIDSYDISNLLSSSYSALTRIASYGDDEEVANYNNYFNAEGSAYEDYRAEQVTYAKGLNANEDVSNLRIDVSVEEYEQISPTKFKVQYEVTFRENTYWSSDRPDSMKHYSKEAIVAFEPTNNPDKDYDAQIIEINNVELLYEE